MAVRTTKGGSKPAAKSKPAASRSRAKKVDSIVVNLDPHADEAKHVTKTKFRYVEGDGVMDSAYVSQDAVKKLGGKAGDSLKLTIELA